MSGAAPLAAPRALSISDSEAAEITLAADAVTSRLMTGDRQQVILSVGMVLIVGGLTVAAFMLGDSGMKSTVVASDLGFASIIVNFVFGSSAGSQRKDAVIASATQRSSAT